MRGGKTIPKSYLIICPSNKPYSFLYSCWTSMHLSFNNMVTICSMEELIQLPHLSTIFAYRNNAASSNSNSSGVPHAEMDVEICGYTIHKHTHVIVNAWVIA